MKLYYVNSGEQYCGHKHKTREAAERCNANGRVLCYGEPPPEGSQDQYEADAEEDARE